MASSNRRRATGRRGRRPSHDPLEPTEAPATPTIRGCGPGRHGQRSSTTPSSVSAGPAAPEIEAATPDQPSRSSPLSSRRPTTSTSNAHHTRSAGKSVTALLHARAVALGQDVARATEEDFIKAIEDLHREPPLDPDGASPAKRRRLTIREAAQKSPSPSPPASPSPSSVRGSKNATSPPTLTAHSPGHPLYTGGPCTAEAPGASLAATATYADPPDGLQDSDEAPTPPPCMTTRNKPRPGYTAKDDLNDSQEEQALWVQIQADLRKCSALQKKQITATERMRELNELINKAAAPPSKWYRELDSLARDVLKWSQEEQRLLNEEPTDIIRNIEILKALRTASGNDAGRAGSPPARNSKEKPRHKHTARLEADAVGSPGPSPGGSGRIKGSGARSSSVVGGRESVKPDDTSTEGSKGPSAERAGRFFIGAEVAYKQAKPKDDGSQWIQCTILSITERNGKKRYEVQDPEPDDTGAPGDIYTASASALIAIPGPDADLPELQTGKIVLARYPETTTFYRAEVTGSVPQRSLCKLKFEDDQNQQMEVDRRFVLSLDK